VPSIFWVLAVGALGAILVVASPLKAGKYAGIAVIIGALITLNYLAFGVPGAAVMAGVIVVGLVDAVRKGRADVDGDVL
jgi:ABC-type sulfate transport system permease component